MISPGPIESAFWRFHTANPAVYTRLVELAMGLRRRGHRKGSMKMLFEVLRWQEAMETTSTDEFKLNNSYTALYARLVARQVPALEEFFTMREQTSIKTIDDFMTDSRQEPGYEGHGYWGKEREL